MSIGRMTSDAHEHGQDSDIGVSFQQNWGRSEGWKGSAWENQVGYSANAFPPWKQVCGQAAQDQSPAHLMKPTRLLLILILEANAWL